MNFNFSKRLIVAFVLSAASVGSAAAEVIPGASYFIAHSGNRAKHRCFVCKGLNNPMFCGGRKYLGCAGHLDIGKDDWSVTYCDRAGRAIVVAEVSGAELLAKKCSLTKFVQANLDPNARPVVVRAVIDRHIKMPGLILCFKDEKGVTLFGISHYSGPTSGKPRAEDLELASEYVDVSRVVGNIEKAPPRRWSNAKPKVFSLWSLF